MIERASPPDAFEIGLVMAGAASAGAYTAGVVDFLLEALSAWEEEKTKGDPSVPDHDVVIRVASGASAGGITAALLGMLPFTGHAPMRDLASVARAADAEASERNLLYRCWVAETDLRRMLSIDDFEGVGSCVPSLLNGTVLTGIADHAIAAVRAGLASPSAAPCYLANPLHLYLTLTNMRGVPYVVRMNAGDGQRGYFVQSHADYAQFAVLGTGPGAPGPIPAGAIPVNSAALPDGLPGSFGDGWDALRDAALATSAFPGGFPARRFRNPASAYRQRPWIDQTATAALPTVCLELAASFDGTYDFWCVDGGLMDNEPLDCARRALAKAGGRGDALHADHALLLIDPFPNGPIAASPIGVEAPDMLESVLSLLPMLRAQAAFRPRDLVMALAENVRTRFLIAPVRQGKEPGETALASDGLGGFAGFVDEQFRLHDFQLGRRNCQQFLQDRFYLHVGNPLFQCWRPRAEAEPMLFADYHPSVVGPGGAHVMQPDFVQIIPLVGAARDPVELRPWPKLDREWQVGDLQELIERRADKVVPRILHSLLRQIGLNERRLINRVLRAVASDVITRRVARSALSSIESDLVTRKLL